MEKTTESKSLAVISVEKSAEQFGADITSGALNSLLRFVGKKYGQAKVLFGDGFTRYLRNAYVRYNQVRTLATGYDVRSIIGHDSIYVHNEVGYKGQTILTDSVDPLLRIGKNIFISGTGGAGKSMLMRYLFLNTCNRGEYIPILLELRKISNLPVEKISILDLVYSCMEAFDTEINREQFEYSLTLGKYLFLLDGFDEIRESHAAKAATAIQEFCSKYPKNQCILTSRPNYMMGRLETFHYVQTQGLSVEHAKELIRRIQYYDFEKTDAFCIQLDSHLYEQKKEFADNPLLLTMMFLTFVRNNSIAEHLADFYGKTFDALYSTHDSLNKGDFEREYKSGLTESQFKMLLSRFCFITYHVESYEFSEDRIIHIFRELIEQMRLETNAYLFLKDLQNIVCFIVKEGNVYKFSHRSFQTYFCAVYTAQKTDIEQQTLFESLLGKTSIGWEYYNLLFEIEPNRFLKNVSENSLRSIISGIANCRNPAISLFRHVASRIEEEYDIHNDDSKPMIHLEVKDRYTYNALTLFLRYYGQYTRCLGITRLFMGYSVIKPSDLCHLHARAVPRCNPRCEGFAVIYEVSMTRDEDLTDLVNSLHIAKAIECIQKWLHNIDAERERESALISFHEFIEGF